MLSPKVLARWFLERSRIFAVRYSTLYRYHTKTWSVSGRRWNLDVEGTAIGGWVVIPNASKGYHGIMKQWWDFYGKGKNCLLISETNKVKEAFLRLYPDWHILTLDLFPDINDGCPDILADICKPIPSALVEQFDLVICQATLEHVFDPAGAFANMIGCLRQEGLLSLHTHTPPFMYHPCPRDYLRFNIDWFEDVSHYIGGVELLELHAAEGHIFTLYRRIPEDKRDNPKQDGNRG